MWTTVANAIADLRTLLSDGPTDKYCSQKNVFGKKDGTNRFFKTFERRRTTNLTTAAVPFGIFVDGVLASVATDYPDTGEFILTTAPTNTKTVVATYYYQWWTDAELTLFLKNATQWIGSGEDPAQIPPALQPAALHYAGQEAYAKLSMWWSIRMADMYKLEDAPPKSMQGVMKSFAEQGKWFEEKSEKLRKQVYTRQDQAEAPLFGVNAGSVRDSVPRR